MKDENDEQDGCLEKPTEEGESVMRRAILIMMVGAVMTGAVTSVADVVAPLHLIPVVAKISGAAGTDWMTDLSMANISEGSVLVTAMFFEENRSNSMMSVPTHTFTVGAGETMNVHDVLGSWFPGESNTKGALLLTGELMGEEGEALLAVSTRVFNNADPSATYGQTVVSGFSGVVIAHGVSVLPGAQWDSRVRSNVGVLNISMFSLDVIITTYRSDGSIAGEVTRTIPSFSLRQWGLNDLGVGSLSTPGRVEVEIDPDTITWDPCAEDLDDMGDIPGVFEAYISRVDNTTGDAEFVLGQVDWTGYVLECGNEPPGSGEECK